MAEVKAKAGEPPWKEATCLQASPMLMAASERPCEAPRIPSKERAGVGGLRPRSISIVFVWVIFTEILVNFDGGGTAAVLEHLERGCPSSNGHVKTKDGGLVRRIEPEAIRDRDAGYPCLHAEDQGVLGSLPYVGLCIAAPVVGQLLQRYDEKQLVLAGLIANTLATLVFSHAKEKHLLFITKFLIGLSHSGIVIYAPVWVDAFAPEQRKTLWLGIAQGSSAIGVMVGYAVAGYLAASGYMYQLAFQIQALFLVFSCVWCCLIPSKYINASYHINRCSATDAPVVLAPGKLGSINETSGDEVPASGEKLVVASKTELDSVIEQIQLLLRNPIYCWTCFELCALFFVVTGIQYWTSKYFKVSFQRSDMEVTSVFIIVSGTGPIFGVAVGSWIIDRLGGYKDLERARRTAGICTSWGLVATLAGMTAAAIEPAPLNTDASFRFYSVVTCIWVQLFFGAAMLPAATGMLITSVPEHVKPFASGVAMVMYNLLGYALGAFLPGAIADRLEQTVPRQARMTMTISFSWALIALVGSVHTYRLMQDRNFRWEPGTCPGSPSGFQSLKDLELARVENSQKNGSGSSSSGLLYFTKKGKLRTD